MPRVVIVGASVGGLRVAESLRTAGYAGDITVVGEEPWLPYNRPPLSKEALAGGLDHAALDHASLELRRRKNVADVRWRLGEAVVASDVNRRTVTLAGGEQLPWDALVAATGLRARRLPLSGPADQRYVLRNLDDAVALRAVLRPGAGVVVLGAGFIGCEVAATATALGCRVVNVAVDAQPMIRALGEVVAKEMRARLEQRGLHFRLGLSEVTDADVIDADVVVEAVGSLCNTEWLEHNGLDLSDGVLTDSLLRAVATDGTPVDGVHVVGDLARFPNAAFPVGSAGRPAIRRVEHWSVPSDTGRRAGMMLAGFLSGAGYPNVQESPFSCLPSFWSDQFDLRLQSFGIPGPDCRVEIIEGSLDSDFVAGYYDVDTLVAVVALNMTRAATAYRSTIMPSDSR